MLTNCYLVVTSFHFKSHLSQNIDNFPTGIIRQVCWRQVKVATLVIHFQCRIAIFIQFEKEKFWLRTKIERLEAQCFHMFESSLKVTTRISCKGNMFCRINITDQACYTAIFISPRKNCPSIQIRIKIHIRFIDPNKSLDRRTVKHSLI